MDLKSMSRQELENYTQALERRLNSLKENITVDQWQGKSSFGIETGPIYYNVIKYQKVKGGEPKQIETKILISDVKLLNTIILNQSLNQRIIKTRRLAEAYCYGMGISVNHRGATLWEDNKFVWDNFFSWRKMHNRFTLMLNILDKQGKIEYKGGIIRNRNI